MTKTVKIPVPGGLPGHGSVHYEVVLREPTYDEFMEIGEITTLAQTPDGTLFQVESADKIRQYIATCLVEPRDPLLLPQGGHRLARALKGAVLGFFRDDVSETERSKTSQTTSSSKPATDGSTPEQSAA